MLEQQLNELGIYALREFARRTGVKSPTSKKKEQLIKEILEIREGKMAPQGTKSKQGRPPKNYGYLGNVFPNMFSNGEFSQNPVIVLNQKINNYNKVVKTESVVGYVDVSTNVASFVWVNVDGERCPYYLPADLVCKYNLKTGDVVLVNNEFVDGQNIVKEILTINNCPINKWNVERNDYDNIKYVEPCKYVDTENAKYNSLKILCGESVYVYGNNNKENTQTMVKFLNAIKGFNKLYLNISLVEKNKFIIDELQDTEIFCEKVTSTADQIKRVVRLFLERIKRLFEDGKNVVVVIDDLQSVVGVEPEEMMLAKQIVALAKNANIGSVTLMVVMPNNSYAIFEKLADKRFKIFNGELANI